MKKTAIIDYGLGNLRSVIRGLEKAGANAVITADAAEIAAADALVLPGVGAFREGMDQLGPLKETVIAASRNVPLLGICLGMQMLMETSEEHGIHRGLGLVPGCVKRFPHGSGMKVPHMGWNSLEIRNADHPLFAGLRQNEYVYFVHSFYADTTPEFTLTTTQYICPFASTVANRNVFGVQFHPEKSGAAGLRLLRNFVGMV
ncbi:imidazole glycerol phosphate synthase subunit HisH [Methanoregula sp. PtaB.Bin085]|uniref:imidazole glycerol phosphate synthase subunit HisH n=1 Tax=Methanoregula sp. PtaB.Bin085 TaxID=1811680 RepID=UPI0009C4725C|nr:imidazole glycerol phosphate synthase subunit HisH [Methanoregula sp. PtaB.Bin085]OPX63790.1 MAG: GMP synthase (glutamine-hydrolyzing) subunit A [Methanoregula sp. PtaB.Bin085]